MLLTTPINSMTKITHLQNNIRNFFANLHTRQFIRETDNFFYSFATLTLPQIITEQNTRYLILDFDHFQIDRPVIHHCRKLEDKRITASALKGATNNSDEEFTVRTRLGTVA